MGHLESDDLRRDRRADVCPHDDADRLRERHHSRRYEANHQHRRYRRRLDDRGHGRAGSRCHEAIGREFGKGIAEAGTRRILERVGHLIHPEQKYGEAPQKPHCNLANSQLMHCVIPFF